MAERGSRGGSARRGAAPGGAGAPRRAAGAAPGAAGASRPAAADSRPGDPAAPPRRRGWRFFLPLVVVIVVLGGLGATAIVLTADPNGAPPAPTPAPSTAPPVDTQLKAKVPATLTAATAETETKRLADAMQALIDPSLIVHVDDTSQLVPASADSAAYYGVLRAITLTPAADPRDFADGLVSALESAGWVARQTADNGKTAQTSLSSSTNADTSWLVLVGGDASVSGESVVSIQLASPDLPAS